MINSRLFIVVAMMLGVVFVANLAQAATTDFTADGNITIPAVIGDGVTADLLIMSGSRAESWNYDSGVFTVTNPNSDFFRVGSADSGVASIRVFNSGAEVACADNTTNGSSYVQLPSTSGAYLVYPYDAGCSVAATAPTPVSQTSGSVARKISAPVFAPNFVPQELQLTRMLTLGISGDDVKSLQKFLNANGFTVADFGPGSIGQETNFFGAATCAAVIKFQLASGIIQSANDDVAGLVGPKTRARINLIDSLQKQLHQLSEQLKQLLKDGRISN